MASNDATIADQDGEYDDWIELYNNGSEVINLEQYYLSDDADDLMKWEFTPASSINAGDSLIERIPLCTASGVGKQIGSKAKAAIVGD